MNYSVFANPFDKDIDITLNKSSYGSMHILWTTVVNWILCNEYFYIKGSASFTIMTIYNPSESARHTYAVNITVVSTNHNRYLHELQIVDNVLFVLYTQWSVGNYGDYKMCAETKNPKGSHCDYLEIRNTEESATSEPDATPFSVTKDAEPVEKGISAAVIAVIVVGGIILVLIVVILFLCKKRGKASNTSKKYICCVLHNIRFCMNRVGYCSGTCR